MVGELIDRYLHDVHGHLRVTGAYEKRVLEELRDHLEQATADIESDGLSAHEATEQAIASLGPASEVAGRFAPAATRLTRFLAVLAGLGALVGLGAMRVANDLHADGERLGADVRYSVVWSIGIAAAVTVLGLLVALALRLGGRQRAMRGAVAAAAIGLGAIGAFHLANDGSLDTGPGPDAWRLTALGAGVAASGLFLVASRRAGTTFAGPALATFGALTLLTVHYTVLDQRGPMALVGVTALALAWLWALGTLVRERPLA
jgi:hypothetical protein